MPSKNIKNNKREFIADIIVTIMLDYKLMSKYLVNPNDKKAYFTILLRAEKDYKKANTIHISVTITNEDIFAKEYIVSLYDSLMDDPILKVIVQKMINKICKDSNRKPEDITAIVRDKMCEDI